VTETEADFAFCPTAGSLLSIEVVSVAIVDKELWAAESETAREPWSEAIVTETEADLAFCPMAGNLLSTEVISVAIVESDP
jgi:hypothetical protein